MPLPCDEAAAEEDFDFDFLFAIVCILTAKGTVREKDKQFEAWERESTE
jgi:hypothetical protein